MRNYEILWETVRNYEKLWETVRNCEKRWETVKNGEKQKIPQEEHLVDVRKYTIRNKKRISSYVWVWSPLLTLLLWDKPTLIVSPQRNKCLHVLNSDIKLCFLGALCNWISQWKWYYRPHKGLLTLYKCIGIRRADTILIIHFPLAAGCLTHNQTPSIQHFPRWKTISENFPQWKSIAEKNESSHHEDQFCTHLKVHADG